MLLLAPLILKRYKLAMILYIVIAGKLRNSFRMSDTSRYTIPVIAFSLPPLAIVLRLRTTRADAPHEWC